MAAKQRPEYVDHAMTDREEGQETPADCRTYASIHEYATKHFAAAYDALPSYLAVTFEAMTPDEMVKFIPPPIESGAATVRLLVGRCTRPFGGPGNNTPVYAYAYTRTRNREWTGVEYVAGNKEANQVALLPVFSACIPKGALDRDTVMQKLDALILYYFLQSRHLSDVQPNSFPMCRFQEACQDMQNQAAGAPQSKIVVAGWLLKREYNLSAPVPAKRKRRADTAAADEDDSQAPTPRNRNRKIKTEPTTPSTTTLARPRPLAGLLQRAEDAEHAVRATNRHLRDELDLTMRQKQWLCGQLDGADSEVKALKREIEGLKADVGKLKGEVERLREFKRRVMEASVQF
ncbi:hypothetical protein BDV95DRAFT_205408 [Massariosphaeria phaeospora]|uniref:Uncharacterized protein n=1 Tax=Massariosphaeria phaeospora TaxID=100035 RepID=A0A7C8M2H2_9PLEO|nr:hypothetical protein BDV95DRAFT_205408 [Massariosphaeria phaeospora]